MPDHQRNSLTKRRAFLAIPTCLVALSLAVAHAGVADVVINEIHYDPAARGRSVEFIELLNHGDESVNLDYWHVDDAVEFTLPQGTSIAPGGFLVLAGDPEAVERKWSLKNVLGPWRGKLSNEGETITLRDAEGKKVDEVDFAPGFPFPSAAGGTGASMELAHPQLDNSEPGNWRSSIPAHPEQRNAIYVPAGSDGWRFFKGIRAPSRTPDGWRSVEFGASDEWGTGRAPFGYGDGDDATVFNDMLGRYTTVYLRKSFELTGTLPDSLLLRIYSDDGAAAWINGIEIARLRGGRGELTHRATASPNHEAAWEDILVPGTSAILREGTNVLAVMGLNGNLTSSDFSIDAELRTTPAAMRLPQPSPGRSNVALNSGEERPSVLNVEHAPASPKPGEAVTVRAEVANPNFTTSATLSLQIVEPGDYISHRDKRYENEWRQVPMRQF